ncbi:MAG TPA: S8 family serine peptidase [Phycisphaerae bacterium]|nr:S8 family serine peptidase [Phycisphaerae bacterium]
MNTRARRHASQILTLAVSITIALISASRADVAQNSAVQGDNASLTTAGFGNLNGTGINVGVVEADDAFANAFYGAGAADVTAPNSTLTNGNSDLPGARINFPQLPAIGGNPAGQLPRGANAGNFPNANFRIGNHASEVTGVVIGQGNTAAADLGIAPGSRAQFAARDNLGVGGGNTAAGQNDSAATIQLVAQQPNTPVVNMSWGTPIGNTITGANGSSTVTRFVDWAATRYDTLMVVAGNEGSMGIPSDSFNSINVAATGARGFYNNGVFQIANGGAVLNYGVAASYNTTNVTTDVSPITGYGRFKTDIVAPGGNPASAAAVGTFNAPPAFDNGYFQTTAGGQYEYSSTNAGGVPFYNQDSFNGGATTTQYGTAGDNTAPFIPGPPFANRNPGPNLGAGDFVQAGSLAGTSFAAPLVSGASSLVYQYYVNSPVGQGFSADHRVMKAILLNGATHTGPDGNPITRADAATQWARLPGKGITPLPAGTTAAQFGGSNPTVQPGLDPQLGTGLLNEVGSLKNYAAGRQPAGLVNPIGWDLNTITAGAAANTIVARYTINVPVSGLFKATLCWDAPVTIGNAGAGGTWQPASTLTRNQLTDLDLYLFQVLPGGALGNNIDYSTSDIDNVEYLYDNLPAGNYQIDIVNAQFNVPQDTTYGLAWSVPEPTTLLLIALGFPMILRRRRA